MEAISFSKLPIMGGSEAHFFIHKVNQEALQITAKLNSAYHTLEKIRALMEKLTGKSIAQIKFLFKAFLSVLKIFFVIIYCIGIRLKVSSYIVIKLRLFIFS